MMINTYYTYVLYSESGNQLYIGHSNDLDRRINQHNIGKVRSTKPYIPYRLVYHENFSTKQEAISREKELKKTEGRRFLRKFIPNH